MFWTAALSQAALWTLLPTLFYSAPPGEVPIVLAVGHEFQLGTDRGPPLAFWLAEIAYRAQRRHRRRLSAVADLHRRDPIGRSSRSAARPSATAQAVLAVLLMVGILHMIGADAGFRPCHPGDADLGHGAAAFLARGRRRPQQILVRACGRHGAAAAHDLARLVLSHSARFVLPPRGARPCRLPQRRSLAMHVVAIMVAAAVSGLAVACGLRLEAGAWRGSTPSTWLRRCRGVAAILLDSRRRPCRRRPPCVVLAQPMAPAARARVCRRSNRPTPVSRWRKSMIYCFALAPPLDCDRFRRAAWSSLDARAPRGPMLVLSGLAIDRAGRRDASRFTSSAC